jgi:SulP family sulfate permease
LPKNVLLYEITGPLFFGAVDNAVDAIDEIGNGVDSVIFLLEHVNAMDITGLVAFESAVKRLLSHHRRVFLVGVRPQPLGLIHKSQLRDHVTLCHTLEEAAQLVRTEAAAAQ